MRSWRESLQPVRMERIAVLAPDDAVRQVLVRVADAGTVELDGPAAKPAPGAVMSPEPVSGTQPPELAAGEAQLSERMRAMTTCGEVTAVLGWTRADAVTALRERLAEVGGAVAVLPRPLGVEVPSLLRTTGVRGSLGSLVNSYGAVPYRDVDPTPLAVAAFLLMFGMMFGDAGHGVMLLVVGVALAFWPRLRRYRHAWPFAVGAGLSGIAFGILYGEFFGPTGLLPALWLKPLERPGALMAVAVFGGAVLLAGALVLGTVNRAREAGWVSSVYAPSGFAGVLLLAGLGLAAGGWYVRSTGVAAAGAALALLGMLLAFCGFLGETGVFGAFVELFDTVLGLGSNVASFTRLAAFGLTHAALGLIVWAGTRAVWPHGAAGAVGAAVVFVAGNIVAFVLEGLVVAIQALRLEYYELFSRVFVLQGRPFRPWHVPTATEGISSWSPG